ncbi:MAG: 50S ribosomal protein L25 [Myxococcaceae bacterium]
MSIDRNVLEAQAREGAGKGFARRLRAKGLVPAVVYGRRMEKPDHIAVDPLLVKKAIATPHKFNTLLTVKVSGKPDRQVLLKDYQQDPVSRDILHVDFIDVRENEAVKVNVPLVLTGKAIGVLEGGILSQLRRELEVHALPAAIPEKIEVDVSHLKVAQALHINDVKLPAGIKVKTHVNFTVAVVAIPEKEEVVVAAVAATPAAGAAGAAAPAGADGKAAAPAAGGDAKAGAGAPAKADAKKEEKKK